MCVRAHQRKRAPHSVRVGTRKRATETPFVARQRLACVYPIERGEAEHVHDQCAKSHRTLQDNSGEEAKRTARSAHEEKVSAGVWNTCRHAHLYVPRRTSACCRCYRVGVCVRARGRRCVCARARVRACRRESAHPCVHTRVRLRVRGGGA
eukprot:1463902-Pleurochrysis_carterae.AAC.1